MTLHMDKLVAKIKYKNNAWRQGSPWTVGHPHSELKCSQPWSWWFESDRPSGKYWKDCGSKPSGIELLLLGQLLLAPRERPVRVSLQSRSFHQSVARSSLPQFPGSVHIGGMEWNYKEKRNIPSLCHARPDCSHMISPLRASLTSNVWLAVLSKAYLFLWIAFWYTQLGSLLGCWELCVCVRVVSNANECHAFLWRGSWSQSQRAGRSWHAVWFGTWALYEITICLHIFIFNFVGCCCFGLPVWTHVNLSHQRVRTLISKPTWETYSSGPVLWGDWSLLEAG